MFNKLVMKLIGNKTEQEIRAELIESSRSLFSTEEDGRLIEEVYKLYPETKTAYVLHWRAEQGEDLYKVLVNDNVIIEIEIDRVGQSEPIIGKSLTIPQYLKGLKRKDQIQLAVALDLAKKDIENARLK
jgi:hypothetical protein